MKLWPLIGLLATFAYADYPVYETERAGIIYNGALGSVMPGFTRAADGDLLVQFNTATDGWAGGRSYIVRSADEGNTWSAPDLLAVSSITTAGIATDIGLTTLSNGDIVFAFSHIQLNDGAQGFPNPVHPGDKWVYPNIIISTDNGHTFGPWIRAPGMEAGFGSPFGRIVEMPDGRLFLPMWMRYEWFNKDPMPSWGHSGYAVSHDKGRTWGEFTPIGPYGETSMVLGNDKTTLFTSGKRNATYWLTRFCRSDDSGTSWHEQETSNFFGGKNASLHISPNGYLLSFLNFGIPDSAKHRGYVIFSRDEARTWYEGYEVHPPLESDTVGYYGYGINAINLGNDRMMLVYYSEDPFKPNTSPSPFEPTTAYVAYTIIKETIRPGDPPEPALTDPKPANPQNIATSGPNIYAYPCPWRGDRHSSVPIQFSNIPAGSNVKIYTISAHLVASIPEVNGKARWDLTNFSGERVASGIYLFSANQTTGKFAIIR